MVGGVQIGGVFTLEYVRPDGTPGWLTEVANAWTDAGIRYLLEVGFRGDDSLLPQKTVWSAGLIDDLGFVGVSKSDTLAYHPGWAEFRQVYQARPGVAARATQPFAPANGGTISSEQPATFTLTSGSSTVTLPNSAGAIGIVGDGTIRGAYLADGSYIGQGTVLICTAILPPESAGLPVELGGRLRIGYTLRARAIANPPAPYLDGDAMIYPTAAELVAATGGDLRTTGEERVGVVYYSTAVGAVQRYAAGVGDVGVLYSSGVGAAAATTVYDKITLSTGVNVGYRRRTLIDGRADILATGLYRR